MASYATILLLEFQRQRSVCQMSGLQHTHYLTNLLIQNTLELLYTGNENVSNFWTEITDMWLQDSNCHLRVYLGVGQGIWRETRLYDSLYLEMQISRSLIFYLLAL